MKNFKNISIVIMALLILCFFSIGNAFSSETVKQFEASLKTMDVKEQPMEYVEILMKLTQMYQNLGVHQKSLDACNKVLPQIEQIQKSKVKALFYNMLGDVHLSMGNLEKTVEYAEKSVHEAKLAENPRILAQIYNNIGNILAVTGDLEGAMGAFGESLAQMDELKNLGELKTTVLINIVRATFLSEKYEEAALAMDYALEEIGQLPDSISKVDGFLSLGLLIMEIHDKKKELLDAETTDQLIQAVYQSFSSAKIIASQKNNVSRLSLACGYMGRLYEQKEKYEDAVTLTRTAVFHAQQAGDPGILYQWQWQLGRLFKAMGDMDASIKRYQAAVGTLNPIRKELFIGYRGKRDVFNERVKPVYLGLAELYLIQAGSIADKKRKEEKLYAARDTMELLKKAELQEFFQDECVAAVTIEKKEINRSPVHTAVIYPIVLPNSLEILLTLPDGLKHVTVHIDAKTIKTRVTQFRKRLQIRPFNRFLYDSKYFYDCLIRPIEADLLAYEIDTLVIAPDGELRLIPFSTLNDGKQFLIEKYAIATIPAISLTDSAPIDLKKTSILLSGLSDGRQGFSPLPSVTAELRDIKKIMNAEVLIQNEAYNLDNLMQTFQENEFSIVHLATHGVFGGTPEESFLLTYDNKLTMDLLEQMIGLGRYKNQPVELLTLSACQTALGNERAAMGLAGVAVKAGVRSVVATLWYVDDEATSIAIREFYRQLKKPGMTKAKALQSVQKKMISQPRYWHPLYWAPFLLIGNWT